MSVQHPTLPPLQQQQQQLKQEPPPPLPQLHLQHQQQQSLPVGPPSYGAQAAALTPSSGTGTSLYASPSPSALSFSSSHHHHHAVGSSAGGAAGSSQHHRHGLHQHQQQRQQRVGRLVSGGTPSTAGEGSSVTDPLEDHHDSGSGSVHGGGAGSSRRADAAGSSDSSTAAPEEQQAEGSAALRMRKKRNKPTLSCSECVDRKTKCDRGRPRCLACIKRQTTCRYAFVANLIEETGRSSGNGFRMLKAPAKKRRSDSLASPVSATKATADRGGLPTPAPAGSKGAIALSTGLLSNIPYSHPTASNVFGVGTEHPFANYWTCQGGLREVVAFMPDKQQADALLSRYFECVDPVYPMLHRQTFYADYEHYWSMAQAERERTDADFVSLLFVMLALGTQFVIASSPTERKQTAEFYASASNQALRVGSYLNRASMRSVQAMVLLTYFLINDNHASDGWAFAGILMRQAYAIGLHRDPNIVMPDASIFEKQQRRKLWQAVLLQDTFLTVLLSLPPTATHTDVNVDDLMEDESSIANSNPLDNAYIRGSWTLANLVQETICSPRSLDLPVCTTVRHKSKLVSDFKAVYRSFPDTFRSWDPESLAQEARASAAGKRLVRQTLFLTSNYFHNLMLVHASEAPDVPVNVRGALDAAHQAITAFFVLFSVFDLDARVWWVFNHRAFLEALCIGSIVRDAAKEPDGAATVARDPMFIRAKDDINRMIEIMRFMGEGDNGSEVAKTRVQVLSEYL
ncbi:hypothetical protein GGTG_04125 [Gaeumannomyces tritici R3-111a-1]|uniref:Zn(2)-C6 fungal-type domain-containing protein n=1 Tax=Gaeumannomyces tritici (strain R3-111a-1) TaxID=644352 RepID=J3NS80_GAET3|nr:hypothetical protein GGTG_04125 [Gaeumannomyces tritici R3-111a-1]EJT79036.1 hypothetical protein GGTG_04125 [Gaeumannomyces tritici R3-111a-1]